jgi:hypothetical protein
LGSNSVLSGEVSVTQNGTLNVAGSNNVLSGNVDLGASAYQGQGVINVSGSSNTIGGSLSVNSGALTISGAGAGLTVSGSVTFPGNIYSASLTASAGGTLSFPGLTSVSGASNLSIVAEGANSEIDLSSLTRFVRGGIDSLSVTNGGTVLDGSLTTIESLRVTLDGTGTLATSQWGTLTYDTITLEGGTYIFNRLSDIDGSSFNVSGTTSASLPAVVTATNASIFVSQGASMTLPALTTYTNTGDSALEAVGTDSTLATPLLASISVNGTYALLSIEAIRGQGLRI